MSRLSQQLSNSNAPHVLCLSLALQTLHGTFVLEPHYFLHLHRKHHFSLCETMTHGPRKPVRSPGHAGQGARCPQTTGCYGPTPFACRAVLRRAEAHTGTLRILLTFMKVVTRGKKAGSCGSRGKPVWVRRQTEVRQAACTQTRLLSVAHLFHTVLVPAVL